MPLVLANAVNDMVSWLASSEADATSRLVDWAGVLDGGGRMALGTTAAFGAAGVHTRLDRYLNKTGSYDSRRGFLAGP